MRITEASEYLGVSINTLKAMADTGQIKCYKTNGGHRRFKREVLDEFTGVERKKAYDKVTMIYARCSTQKQKENLQRQKEERIDNLCKQLAEKDAEIARLKGNIKSNEELKTALRIAAFDSNMQWNGRLGEPHDVAYYRNKAREELK